MRFAVLLEIDLKQSSPPVFNMITNASSQKSIQTDNALIYHFILLIWTLVINI